jgi:hypothetical protein
MNSLTLRLCTVAITGGTGDYAQASGQAMQIFQGLNASEGVVLDVELEVITPTQTEASR